MGMKELTSKGQHKDGLNFQYPLHWLALKCSQLTRMTCPFLTNQVCSQSKHLSWWSLPLCVISYSWKITTVLLLWPSTGAQKHRHTSQRWASVELTSCAVSDPSTAEWTPLSSSGSFPVSNTTRAAGGAKRKRLIQPLTTCATEKNNLASPNPASSRFWFSSHQQESNQNREDENQKGRQRGSLEWV